MIGDDQLAKSETPARAGGDSVVRTQPRLVSVHMPKTAGTSFAASLQACFGDGYQPDYADMPMQVSAESRQCTALLQSLAACRRVRQQGSACIHGHFLPAKYLSLAAARGVSFVTWLRDPVERLVSHYQFWRRGYAGHDPLQPLRNRMVLEDWSLERFALGPELRNIYAQYLWHFDVARFDFIGITERYADDLAEFSDRFLDGRAVVQTALANPDRCGEAYDVPRRLRDQIEAYHAADVAFYKRARLRRRVGA